MFTHGSLFSGIGGFDLAAEWMGWHNAFHCEINEFCTKILNYHFPDAEHYTDITRTDFSKWRGRIDVLSGGFPCQPFSLAGQRKGADDNRYLWPQMLRAIREIRPTWVVGENVAGILTMVQPGAEVEVGGQASLFGEDYRKRVLHRQEYVIETICRDLEREGYAVQPLLIPACAVGAPHRRDRIWFIARLVTHPKSCRNSRTPHEAGREAERQDWNEVEQSIIGGSVRPASNPNRDRCRNRTNKQKLISECERKADYCYGCKDGITTYSDGDRHKAREEGERAESCGREYFPQSEKWRDAPERFNGLDGFSRDVTDPDGKRLQERFTYGQCKDESENRERVHSGTKRHGGKWDSSYSNSKRQKYRNDQGPERRDKPDEQFKPQYSTSIWENFPTQPPICSGDDGISGRLDGITFSKWRQESVKAYGNAIVPQVAYEIFKAIELCQ